MKKYLLSIVLVGCSLAAYTADYYVGTQPLIDLIQKMDSEQGPFGDIAWPWVDDKTGDHVMYEGDEINSFHNFQLLTATPFGIYVTDNIESDGSILSWATCRCGTYGLLRGIDWSGKNYLQKEGEENHIVFENNVNKYTANSEKGKFDVSLLEFLKLSGNRFRNIEIRGSDPFARLKEVDLSANETLEYFKISGAPNLQTLKVNATTVEISDVTLLFSKLDDIQASTLNYIPTGSLHLSFPLNRVDLSEEFASGTTFSDWSVEPVSSVDGVFAFADDVAGTNVTVTLSNDAYADYGSITVSITLTDGDYRITTAAELDDMRNHLGGKFTLDADIDLSEYLSEGGAGYEKWGDAGWLPIGDNVAAFKGELYGNGHVISGLRINRPTTDFVGLFGCVGNWRALNSSDSNDTSIGSPSSAASAIGAIIKDLGLSVDYVIGQKNVGGLAGVLGSAVVTGCYVNTNVKGALNVGGITGTLYVKHSGAILSDCFVAGKVMGDNRIGGVTGSAFQNEYDLKIQRVVSTAGVRITNSYYDHAAGGIIGRYGAWNGGIKLKSVFLACDTIYGNKTDATNRIIGSTVSQTNPANVNFSDSVYAYKYIVYDLREQGTSTVNVNDTVQGLKQLQMHGKNILAKNLMRQSTYEELGGSAALNWDFSETGLWTMGNGYYPLPVLKKMTPSAYPNEFPEYLKFDVSVATSVIDETGGTISTHAGVRSGDDVTIMVTPDAGKEIDEFWVNGEEVKAGLDGNTYTIFCIKDDYTVSVSFKDISTSIDDTLQNTVKVYPTVTDSEINISGKPEFQAVSVCDLSGRELVRTRGGVVDVSHLPSGIYLVKVAGTVTKIVRK